MKRKKVRLSVLLAAGICSGLLLLSACGAQAAGSSGTGSTAASTSVSASNTVFSTG
ncbi:MULTISPECIES: hypothetical protein [Caproicibacterium]|uniref:Uncharacterized protein n=1 Tax=Caproicibacterium argilliputei TaxID=3030016 RepID=A0AA97DA96_9FIRM|nr:hypothetical protein [Caproicibacterium argilliputei]WOC32317.1 hypothetical protein PXC00_00180 [Caproicibacterium argilliputei]